MVDAVNTGSAAAAEQTTAPEGHDQAMADAYEQSQAQETDTSTGGGEKILGKFESHADLEAAYKELEAKLSGGEAGSNESAPATDSQQQAAEQAVENAEGVDMQSLSQEYAENGSLAAESYEALEKAGISRDVVDQFIEGQEAKASAVQNEILSDIGGQEEFDRMASWASTNLSGEQLDRYNEAVGSGDHDRMREAVQSLAYQYTKANGSEPELVGGGQAAAGSRFDSVAQLTEAMSDPRYATDPAYRKEVEQKIARSNVL